MNSFTDDAAFDRLFDSFGAGGREGDSAVLAQHQPNNGADAARADQNGPPFSTDDLELEVLKAGGPGAVREALLQAKVDALRQARAALAVNKIRCARERV